MSIEFKVNGVPFEVKLSCLPPDITLNTYIREYVGLTGTKFMCLEGGCGVCVCSVKKPEGLTLAVNSCLTLLNICDGWEITTIEGIGNKLDGYHPIQMQLANFNGSQCGYCSPGMIMNMFSLMKSKGGQISMAEIENSFGGNICRCTGYRPILDAMKSFAIDSDKCQQIKCPDIEDLPNGVDGEKCPKTGEKCIGICNKSSSSAVTYKNGYKWFWPKSLMELFEILHTLADQKYIMVAGNTAHGVYRCLEEVTNFIDVNLSNLRNYRIDQDCLTIGANLSLTETMEIFRNASKLPGFEYCQELYNHFDLIANVPVRNMGTLAGNLMIKHAHPEFPSDIFITFEALNVIVMVGDVSEAGAVTLKEFLKMNMKGKVILAFRLQAYPKEKSIFKSFKIMPRAQNSHAYLNSAFFLEINQINRKISYARICFGGINKTFVHAKSTEKLLIGVDLFSNDFIIQPIFECLNSEIVQEQDFVLPDASMEYRRKLACGLFYKFILSIIPEDKIQVKLRSGGEILKRPLSSGKQIFETSPENFVIKQPLKKLEAMIQCSGEAQYMNDVPVLSKQVWCAFVNATKVGSEILNIDASAVLKIPGVVGFFDAKDIPGVNSFVNTAPTFFGLLHDEEIFCDKKVKFHSQPVGMIVAESNALANFAASKVIITYSNDDPPKVFTSMEEVLEANITERIMDGMVSQIKELNLSSPAPISASGYLKLGQQYHFTMEPHTTVVVPVEGGKLEVYSSTQWMDLTQCVIAKCVRINISDVQLKVRRLGGGFGTKITRGNHVACAAALAAVKLNRPARFVQTIESMMVSIGKRWACNSYYDFHVNTQGKILALNNQFYEDAGYIPSENAIESLTGPALINCYDFKEKYKNDGKIVLTDTPSHTWCRGPGSLEGFAMTETIMEHIAFETSLDPVDVRLENIAKDHKIRGLIEQFLKNSEYRERKKKIEKFNEENRWRKKGLGISIMQFDVLHFAPFSATVAIYHGDGTVVISHGGIEMGQGLNTKAAQVAAYLLNIPIEMIRIDSSNTVNGANVNFTGASIGSECVCFAIRKACETLMERLRPSRESMDDNTSWQTLVETAHSQGVNLIASDQFKTGDLETYFVYGISLTEVEIDILTGNLLINRVDILEDTGESLNPAVDVGQIEGAFVMGIGYYLTEQIIYDQKTGELLTNRTWNYKPPGCKDIPIDFRIELIQKSPNPAGFMRSKTTGEPAICMAVSVLFAIQEALQSARKDAGLERKFISLGAPTTPEHIVLNSGYDISQFKL